MLKTVISSSGSGVYSAGVRNLIVSVGERAIQQVLAQPHWANWLTPRDRHAITPLIWDHVNLYGRYELDMESRIPILTSNGG